LFFSDMALLYQLPLSPPPLSQLPLSPPLSQLPPLSQSLPPSQLPPLSQSLPLSQLSSEPLVHPSKSQKPLPSLLEPLV
jgi:hypothetical protein